VDKEKRECQNEGRPVADQDILPLERPELFGVVFVEEGQIDVTRHGKDPDDVREHQPTADASTNSRSASWQKGSRDIPLNQKGLELTQKGIHSQADPRRRYQSGHVGQDVSPRGIEDKAVDGFVECLVAQKGADDEACSDEREHRTRSFRHLKGEDLAGRETHVLDCNVVEYE
jgi:hypothetical protein